jgi:hypothetical protein
MRKFALIAAVALALCGSVYGQDVSRVEAFGGYSYLGFDTSAVHNALIGIPSTVTSRMNTNGWEASLAYNFNKWGGIEGDFSGHYKGDCEGFIGLTCSNLSFMGGPRLTHRRGNLTVFAHGLFGGDRFSLSASAASISTELFGTPYITGFSVSVYETKFALAAGGGADYVLGKHTSIRIAQVDYMMTKHFGEFGLSHQNNLRVSAGIVFRFGAAGTIGVRNPSGPSNSPAQSGSVQAGPIGEVSLLGVTGYSTEDGLKITVVRAGSPAEQIYLKSGDVIAKVDGRQVHSVKDIEQAITASASGTIKVLCLIKTGLGMMPAEREVKVR